MTEPSARAASSGSELLILVDPDDNEAGFLSKAECHDGDGVLHRAFSVFLFNRRGELLLQQRSAEKRLWPLYWSNSCCSHPRKGESTEDAARRRLQEELEVGSELEFVYKFAYQARFGERGSENELCWVFLGCLDEEAKPDAREIEAVRWVSMKALRSELESSAGTFTPWFQLEWQRLSQEFADVLRKYAKPGQG